MNVTSNSACDRLLCPGSTELGRSAGQSCRLTRELLRYRRSVAQPFSDNITLQLTRQVKSARTKSPNAKKSEFHMSSACSIRSTHSVSLNAPKVSTVISVLHMSQTLKGPCDGVIWDRPVPLAVRDWLDALSPDTLPRGRFILSPELAGACMQALFVYHGVSPSPHLRWLCDDVQTLARHVSAIYPSSRLRMRVEPVFDDACRKMHIDAVVARLICTYRGPGTVLGVPTEATDLEWQVPTGAPILLKGKHWPTNTPPTLHHRSPRIEASGLSRLVLVLEGCPDDALLATHDKIFNGASAER